MRRSNASGDADLFLELFHETLQTLMADLRQTLAGGSLETVGEVQQFGLEVIEAKTFVVVVALFRFGILWVVQR